MEVETAESLETQSDDDIELDAEMDDDDEAFADKMQALTAKLGEQMAKGAELDALISQKLGRLGYEC